MPPIAGTHHWTWRDTRTSGFHDVCVYVQELWVYEIISLLHWESRLLKASSAIELRAGSLSRRLGIWHFVVLMCLQHQFYRHVHSWIMPLNINERWSGGYVDSPCLPKVILYRLYMIQGYFSTSDKSDVSEPAAIWVVWICFVQGYGRAMASLPDLMGSDAAVPSFRAMPSRPTVSGKQPHSDTSDASLSISHAMISNLWICKLVGDTCCGVPACSPTFLALPKVGRENDHCVFPQTGGSLN